MQNRLLDLFLRFAIKETGNDSRNFKEDFWR